MSRDSVNKVLDNVVRDCNGKNLLYQCRPAIRNCPAKTQNRQVFDNLTVGDVLQRLKHTKQLLYMVLRTK